MGLTTVVKSANGTALMVDGVIIDPFGAANNQVLAYNSGTNTFAPVSGGATGNWTFSGNNADLTGAGAMGLGTSAATSIRFYPTTLNFANGTSLSATGVIGSTGTTGISIIPNVTDGSGTVGIVLDHTTAISTGKWISVRDAGTEAWWVGASGYFNAVSTPNGLAFVSQNGQGVVRVDDASGAKLAYNTNSLIMNSTKTTLAGPLNLGEATVSQAANINTGVTINGASGVITTQTATTAANAAEAGFTVTNNCVFSGSVVVARVVGYSGTYHTNGQPDIDVTSVGSGSFNCRVINRDGTNALNGTMKIHFNVT